MCFFNSNSKGSGILDFSNLSHRRKDLNANHLFNYFLAIQCNNSEFSMPFLLNKTVSRIGFCINNGKTFVRPQFLFVITSEIKKQFRFRFLCQFASPNTKVSILFVFTTTHLPPLNSKIVPNSICLWHNVIQMIQ